MEGLVSCGKKTKRPYEPTKMLKDPKQLKALMSLAVLVLAGGVIAIQRNNPAVLPWAMGIVGYLLGKNSKRD